MGLLIGRAVFPAVFATKWKGQMKAGATAGAVTGLCAGLLAWLVIAHQYYGSLSVSTTGMEYPTNVQTICGDFGVCGDLTCHS